MKMKKSIVKVVSVVVSASLLASGCVYDGAESPVRAADYDPGIGEREGLATARILTSPMNMLGHTYGECERWGAKSVIGVPFVPLVSVPSGCLAACADILVGTAELISFQQVKSVSYAWESFDQEKSKKWAEPVVMVYAVAAVVLLAWAQDELEKKSAPPPPGGKAPPPPGGRPPPPPPNR